MCTEYLMAWVYTSLKWSSMQLNGILFNSVEHAESATSIRITVVHFNCIRQRTPAAYTFTVLQPLPLAAAPSRGDTGCGGGRNEESRCPKRRGRPAAQPAASSCVCFPCPRVRVTWRQWRPVPAYRSRVRRISRTRASLLSLFPFEYDHRETTRWQQMYP